MLSCVHVHSTSINGAPTPSCSRFPHCLPLPQPIAPNGKADNATGAHRNRLELADHSVPLLEVWQRGAEATSRTGGGGHVRTLRPEAPAARDGAALRDRSPQASDAAAAQSRVFRGCRRPLALSASGPLHRQQRLYLRVFRAARRLEATCEKQKPLLTRDVRRLRGFQQ